jgi:hypothetical protein
MSDRRPSLKTYRSRRLNVWRKFPVLPRGDAAVMPRVPSIPRYDEEAWNKSPRMKAWRRRTEPVSFSSGMSSSDKRFAQA